MSVVKTITTTREFCQPFIERGLIPANTRRFIIDAEVGGVVRLIYETYAEPAIIDAIVEAKLEVKES